VRGSLSGVIAVLILDLTRRSDAEDRMSTVAKVFVVLNLLLAVAVLGAAAAFLGHSDNWKARHDSVRQTSDASIAKVTADFNDQKKANTELTVQIAAANTSKDKAIAAEQAITEAYGQLKKGYDESNASYLTASRALLTSSNTIAEMRRLIDELWKERDALKDKLSQANDAMTAAIQGENKANNALEAATTQLNDTLAKLATSEGDKQRVTFAYESILRQNPGIGAGTEQPAQQGKVLLSDNQANIVVISLGTEDGVKNGFRYTVSRGASYVATIEITNAMAKSAAGRVLTGMSKSPVQPGDDFMTAR